MCPRRCCKQAKFGIPVSVEPLVYPLSNFEENNNIIVVGANGNSNLEKQTHKRQTYSMYLRINHLKDQSYIAKVRWRFVLGSFALFFFLHFLW